MIAAVLSVAAILSSGCGSGGGSAPADGGVTPTPTPGTTGGVLKIFVFQDGIHKLTYDALRSAGFNVAGISTRDLKLTRFVDGLETEVPLRVSCGNDCQLKSGDFLEFYGTGIPRGDRRFEFTETNVYRLKGEAGSRRRITAKSLPFGPASVDESSFPAVLHVEEDTHYWQNMPDEDPSDGLKPDRWMWGGPFVKEEARYGGYYFLIQNPDSASPITLKFRFQARTAYAGHQVSVYLNSQTNLIDTQTWDGLTSHEFTVDIRNKGFVEGTNSLRIVNSGVNDLSQFYLAWFEVDYRDSLTSDDRNSLFFQGSGETGAQPVRRFILKNFTARPDVYDVTDEPSEVGWISPDTYLSGYQFQDLSGRRYVAVTDAGKIVPSVALDETVDLKGARGADEIVIAHEDFYNAILPLVQFRESQGLKVVTAKLGDVYDEFSGGVTDPLAIKEFLKYAHENWNPGPRYVLLVGDASYDYKNHLSYCGSGTVGTCSYLPTYLYEFEGLGEVPSDNWFADVVREDLNGDGQDDGLPEMAVGRIPAKTSTQVTQVVNKILDYEKLGNPKPGEADLRYLFVADDDDTRFETVSIALATRYPDQIPDTNSRFLFLGDGYGVASFRQNLLDALNTGPLFVSYVGHGAVVDWGKEGIFRSESYTDPVVGTIPGVTGATSSLTNQGKYPFVVSLDCLNGNFALPDEGSIGEDGLKIPRSLAEEFLMANAKGAVAVWAASALGYTSDHEVLGQGLFDKMFGENQKVFGDAVLGAMTASSSDLFFSRDVFYTFVFFGDPATELKIPSGNP